MSYKINSLNSSRHIISFMNDSRQSIQFALVEANLKDRKAFNEDSNFETLLIEAVQYLPNSTRPEQFPRNLAISLRNVLAERHKIYKHLFHVGYVGIAIKERTVYICKAGNIRVHLIENGNLLSVTRDHNLIDDPIEGIKIHNDLRMGNIDRETETRQIVANDSEVESSIEHFIWQANFNFSVLVSSAFYHRFLDPSGYITELLELLKKNAYDDPVGGVLAQIQCNS